MAMFKLTEISPWSIKCIKELEVRILLEFCVILQIWEATMAKQMKTDPYFQRQNIVSH